MEYTKLGNARIYFFLSLCLQSIQWGKIGWWQEGSRRGEKDFRWYREKFYHFDFRDEETGGKHQVKGQAVGNCQEKDRQKSNILSKSHIQQVADLGV